MVVFYFQRKYCLQTKKNNKFARMSSYLCPCYFLISKDRDSGNDISERYVTSNGKKRLIEEHSVLS